VFTLHVVPWRFKEENPHTVIYEKIKKYPKYPQAQAAGLQNQKDFGKNKDAS